MKPSIALLLAPLGLVVLGCSPEGGVVGEGRAAAEGPLPICHHCAGYRAVSCPSCQSIPVQGDEFLKILCDRCELRGWIPCPTCDATGYSDAALTDEAYVAELIEYGRQRARGSAAAAAAPPAQDPRGARVQMEQSNYNSLRNDQDAFVHGMGTIHYGQGPVSEGRTPQLRP